MKTTIKLLTLLLLVSTLTGCATQKGRNYGATGGLLGATIGAAAGGLEGAIIGGAAGAGAGGLIGDHETYESERNQWHQDQEYYYRQGPSTGYNRNCYDCQSAPPAGYVEPCRRVYMPVYDRYGYVVGRRLECQ
ncbi:MAG TPA: hypothetical protein PKZ32_03885 [Candidatus Melainabacteria bacterium]|nr:hypothetical protein [Candidatus Melainabacteria bacterium]